MATQLQKAYIEVETGDRIDCMFNPETFAFTTTNKWEPDAVPGSRAPTLRYSGGAGGSFKLKLVFDTTDTGKPVSTYTSKILGLMEVDKDLPGYKSSDRNGRPPWVKFHWGAHLHSFKAVITSSNVAFTYFSQEGDPLRANVDLSFSQFEPDGNWGAQNPTSGTKEPHATHQVQVGDTLDRIAARFYGDSTRWRDIAEINQIDDPLDLTPGAVLAIPEDVN